MRRYLSFVVLFLITNLSLQAFDAYSDTTGVDSCYAWIGQDSLNNPAGPMVLVAFGDGQPPFTYLWSTGETTPTITVTQAGTYCVSIVDALGCVAANCYTYDNSGNSCTVTIIDTLDWGGSDSLYLFAFGTGTPPFTYEWNTGETGDFIFATDTIPYCVTVTDATGCTADTCIIPDFNNYYCWSYINGSGQDTTFVLDAINFGTPPYVYEWDTGENTQQIVVGTEGTYCVSITDATGCFTSSCYAYYPVNQDSCWVYIYPDSTQQPNGGTELWAQAGGTPGYTYSWSNGATTQSIFVLDEGTYCVTATDAVGCEASSCYFYSVGNPDTCVAWIQPLTIGNGESLCAYSSGPGPYTYLWSTGETSFIIDVFQAGEYCVTVVDSWGCEASTCYTYDGPGNVDSCWVYIYADTTQPNGGTQLWAQAGGTPAFTYSWSNGATTQSIQVIDEGTYCVTATDALGCVATSCYYYTVGNPDSCVAWILGLPIGGGGESLCAYSSGPGPYTYLWSTGETSFLIDVFQAGEYCVTVVDSWGCEASTCYTYDPGNVDSCYVYIYTDSLLTNGTSLFALASGVAPFNYLWSTGETTSDIWVTDPGNYCVSVVDAAGCVATNCFYYNNPVDSCSVYIYPDTLNPTGTYLIADTNVNGPAPFTFIWSTGDTSNQILVTDPGTYCVTMTNGAGCVATACYQYLGASPFDDICGYVFPADSSLIGSTTVSLYRLENGSTTLVGTQNFQGEAYGWSYNFEDLPNGDYIIRAEIDAGALAAGDFAPTYGVSELMWDDADIFSVPSNDPYCGDHIVLIPESGGNLNGNGGISGNVNDNGMNGGGLAGITILLLDEFGNIVAHTTTDENGNYSFGNLPLGTYQVMVEMPGFNHANYWITLTEDDPVVDGKDFEIENGSISTGTYEVAKSSSWKVFPNPVASFLYLQLDESWEEQVNIKILSLDGKELRSIQASSRNQKIEILVDQLQSGMYLYQLQDGHQTASGKLVKQ